MSNITPATKTAEGPKSSAPCTGIFQLEAGQAAFSLNCPELGIQVVGSADGEFPVASIDSNDGTLIYWDESHFLDGALQCGLLHKETIISPADKICVYLVANEQIVALFQGNNPPEQDFDTVGKATFFKKN